MPEIHFTMPDRSRPDFTECLIHFTRERKTNLRHFEQGWNGHMPGAGDKIRSPLDVLKEILKDGVIRGSTSSSGYIKGTLPAVCLSEVPLWGVRYFSPVEDGRYSRYGIAISKAAAYDQGARPVIYLPDDEANWIPVDQKWRHVRFDRDLNIDYTFEREWRLQGNLILKDLPGIYVLVWKPGDADLIRDSGVVEDYQNIRGFLPMEHLEKMM